MGQYLALGRGSDPEVRLPEQSTKGQVEGRQQIKRKRDFLGSGAGACKAMETQNGKVWASTSCNVILLDLRVHIG